MQGQTQYTEGQKPIVYLIWKYKLTNKLNFQNTLLSHVKIVI